MDIIRCNSKPLKAIFKKNLSVEYNIKTLEEELEKSGTDYFLAAYFENNLYVKTNNSKLVVDLMKSYGSGYLEPIASAFFTLNIERVNIKDLNKALKIVGDYMISGGSVRTTAEEFNLEYSSILEKWHIKRDSVDITNVLKSSSLYNYQRYITLG